jgi:hypothetical protein
MRTFHTQEETSVFDAAKPITFHIDDLKVTAYPPTETQLALVMVAMAGADEDSDEGGAEMVREVMGFFFGLFDDDDQKALRGKMRDREHPLTVTLIGEIIEALVEEWSKRPTKSSPGSTPSRRSGGTKSTAKRASVE